MGDFQQALIASSTFKAATLRTDDPIEKVAKFYRENMKGATVEDRIEKRGHIQFNVVEEGMSKTVIVMRSPDDYRKTQVAIVVAPAME